MRKRYGGKLAGKQSNDFSYVLIYLLMWITGIVFFVISKEKRQKRHAIQAILLGIIATLVSFIPFVGIFWIIVWIYGLYVGYAASINKEMEIPYITEFAKYT